MDNFDTIAAVTAIIIIIVLIIIILYYASRPAVVEPPPPPPEIKSADSIIDSVIKTNDNDAAAVINAPKTVEVPTKSTDPIVVSEAPPLVIPSDAARVWGSSRDGVIQTDAFGRRTIDDIKYINGAICPSHVTQFYANAGSGVYAIGMVCDDGSQLGPWGGKEGTVQSTQKSDSGFKNVPIWSNYDYVGTFLGLGTNKKSFGDRSVNRNLTCPDDTRVAGIKGQYTDRLRNIGIICKPIGK